MNIQIFGLRKSFDTKKAERWFKERRIKYQYIDLANKGLSAGEYRSVRAAVGYDALVDRDCIDYRELGIEYLLPQAAEEKLLEYQLFRVLSSATASRPPWATAPMCGRLGNNALPAPSWCWLFLTHRDSPPSPRRSTLPHPSAAPAP